MSRLLLASAFLSLASSCAPFVHQLDLDTVSEDETQAAYMVNLYMLEQAGAYPTVHRFLGAVQGVSCKHLLTDPPASKADALLRMRVEAHRLGADAVIDVTIDSSGTDTWGTNCWESIAVNGLAVATTPSAAPNDARPTNDDSQPAVSAKGESGVDEGESYEFFLSKEGANDEERTIAAVANARVLAEALFPDTVRRVSFSPGVCHVDVRDIDGSFEDATLSAIEASMESLIKEQTGIAMRFDIRVQ
ncbi:heavy metal-binding domain-containing protein [Planctomycetota bacterium]|nr:heavy metal-binding domain-containing protein [Planctomycetota bacterium]